MLYHFLTVATSLLLASRCYSASTAQFRAADSNRPGPSSENFLEATTAATITVYPNAPLNASTVFSMTANNILVPVQVPATYHNAAFSASASGLVTVSVTYHGAPITAYSLQPAGADVAGATLSGNIITFSVMAPRKVERRVNKAVTYIGDTPATAVMYLSVDLPEVTSEIPLPTDKSVVYYGPSSTPYNVGFVQYNATNPPPRMIYVAPGALVNGAWRFVGVSNVTISGRGYLRNAFQDKSQVLMYFSGSTNIVIRDIFLIDSPQHVMAFSSGSKIPYITSNVLVDNIKSLHRGGNSDGFSLFGPCHDITIQNILLVNLDNQVIYQAGLPSGPYNNVIQNSIFVKSNSAGNFFNPTSPPASYGAAAVQNGTFGSGNVFSNIDILRLSGEMALILYVGPNAFANMIFDNIRVVTFAPRIGSSAVNNFLQLSNASSQFQKTITFSNSVFPNQFNGSQLGGGWTLNFQNVSIGGTKVTTNAQVGLKSIGVGSKVLFS